MQFSSYKLTDYFKNGLLTINYSVIQYFDELKMLEIIYFYGIFYELLISFNITTAPHANV